MAAGKPFSEGRDLYHSVIRVIIPQYSAFRAYDFSGKFTAPDS